MGSIRVIGLVLGLAILGIGLAEAVKGKAVTKFHVYNRDKDPPQFWLVVLTTIAVGAFVLYTVLSR